jgi:hypothetical protein
MTQRKSLAELSQAKREAPAPAAPVASVRLPPLTGLAGLSVKQIRWAAWLRLTAIKPKQSQHHQPDAVDIAFADLMIAVAQHYEPATQATWWISYGRAISRHILADLLEDRCTAAIRAVWSDLQRNPNIQPAIRAFRVADLAFASNLQEED